MPYRSRDVVSGDLTSSPRLKPGDSNLGWSSNSSRFPAGSCFDVSAAPAGAADSRQAATASPAARMFLAAFTSACPVYEHEVHRKTAWLSRDFGSTCPHAEQRCDVNAAGTFTTCVPVYRDTDVNPCSKRYHPLDKMALFKPDFLPAPLGRERPGVSGSLAGFARLVMFFAGSFSSTTTAFFSANARAVLTQKSWRRRASSARSPAYCWRVLLRLAEPLAA